MEVHARKDLVLKNRELCNHRAMLKWPESFKSFVEKASPRYYSILLAVPILFLIIGFFIWNIYLYTFGFFEDELLRGKFILTGFAFIAITLIACFLLFIPVGIFLILWRWSIKKINSIHFDIEWKNKTKSFIIELFDFEGFGKFVSITMLFVGWLLFYTLNIFPSIPNVFGGGQPVSISLVATEEGISVMNSFGIANGTGAKYQTQSVCLVHENSKGIYLLLDDRILMVDNSFYNGFVSLPGPKSVSEQKCIDLAQGWSHQGFSFSKTLMLEQLGNIYRKTMGLPPIYFDIVPPQKFTK